MTSKPFVSSFQGKLKLSSAEFVSIFKKYDKDGNGKIEASELDGFLRDLAEEHGDETEIDVNVEDLAEVTSYSNNPPPRNSTIKIRLPSFL